MECIQVIWAAIRETKQRKWMEFNEEEKKERKNIHRTNIGSQRRARQRSSNICRRTEERKTENQNPEVSLFTLNI